MSNDSNRGLPPLRRACDWLKAGVVIAAVSFSSSAVTTAAETYDVVIRGGRIVDGTGAPWYRADLALRDGKIVHIGRIAEGADVRREIDATGKYVAPGFIDLMGQSATPLLRNSETALNVLSQGITTINCGEGASAAPLNEADGRAAGWNSMREYFALLEMKGLPLNVVQTVGHTQLRRLVIGETDRRATADELLRMQQHVEEAMTAGAIGVSTALIYPPATYAPLEEIAALCGGAGKFGGRYFTHMRNEGDRLLEAIDEALEIGRLGGTPVHIFHLKTAGRQNWGKMEQALAAIKAARREGQPVTADIYPYIHNGLSLISFVHPRRLADGRAQFLARLADEDFRADVRSELETTDGWENWYRHVGKDWNRVIIGRTSLAPHRDHPGESLAQLATRAGVDAWDLFFKLIAVDTFALPETMSEANKALAMREEFISFCTDVGPASGQGFAAHPRASGSFPRLLSRYVRDWGVLSLEQFVSQASAGAANNVLAFDRGRLAVGLAADVIVFDYDSIAERATFADPSARSEGIEVVIVNGELVYENGKLTTRRPGRVLRGPGFDQSQSPSEIRTGQGVLELAALDTLMQHFLEQHRGVGAALAVTDHGRLVYARGFGYADLAANEHVQPDSLFRIASVSKPLTAVAILQLVEAGKLGLDDPVLPLLQEDPFLENDAQFDERWRQITIRHLLQHRGGWDRDKSYDAMFKAVSFAKELGVDAPAGPHDVIRVMLGRPLDFEPGERYVYSNLGYCLLGRVIESLSGKGYEDYVRERVLRPLGPSRARLGRTHLEQRAPGEVRYYDPQIVDSVFQADLGRPVPSAYGGWHLEAMDAHGAWIASAVDLARFVNAFDPQANKRLLGDELRSEMDSRPEGVKYPGRPASYYYSLGWSHYQTEDGVMCHGHNGALPGTSTGMIRRDDGRDFVVLFNARVSPASTGVIREFEPLLHKAISEIQVWPEHDLYSQFTE